MKQFVTSLLVFLCCSAAYAQTFIEDLQKKKPAQGTVTVVQSKDIDELVNGSNAPKKETKTVVKKQSDNTGQKKTTVSKSHETTTKHEIPVENHDGDSTFKEEKTRHESARSGNEDTDMDIPTVDLRKKVMRQGYKVSGFRIQAFSGGNTRQDKIKAQQIGNNIKISFPDQPVYVHFYSPRWTCRVGNYRSINEANRMLRQIKALGYKSAIIIKGKITIQ